jgi:hypothetical protein
LNQVKDQNSIEKDFEKLEKRINEVKKKEKYEMVKYQEYMSNVNDQPKEDGV